MSLTPLLILFLLGAAAVVLALSAWLLRARRRLRAQRYQRELEAAVADGVITAEETRQLEELRVEAALTEADVRHAAVRVYRRALEEAMADSRITAEEEATLARLREQLGLSAADLEADRDNLRRVHVLSRLEHGQLPDVEPPLGLPTGEAGHWVIHATFCERLSLPGHRGAEPRHIVFPIDGGQPFSVSAPRDALASSAQILPTDLGVIVISGRATRFNGALTHVELPHSRLRRIALFSDGLRLDVVDPVRSHYFLLTDPELTAAVLLLAARRSTPELPGQTA